MMSMGYALANMEERRHLSGREFLEWLTRMLKDQFGYMGRWLLLHYGLENRSRSAGPRSVVWSAIFPT